MIGFINGRIESAFKVIISPRELQVNLAISRVLFGLITIYMSVSVYGFAVIADDPGKLTATCALGAIFGLMICGGVLTPVALLGLIAYYLWPGMFIYNLGTLVMTVLAWLLLLFGAGESLGFDAYLRRQRLFRWIYCFSTPLTSENLAYLRFFGIFLYWALTLSAMVYHFDDPFWQNLDVLPLILTSGYITDYYELFSYFRSINPLLFVTIGKAGLFIQGIWEIGLIFLCFFAWGRRFVHVQGYLFFFSCFLLNLDVLPYAEIILWLLLFGDAGRIAVWITQKIRGLTVEDAKIADNFQRTIIDATLASRGIPIAARVVIGAGVSAACLMTVQNTSLNVFGSAPDFFEKPFFRTLFDAFGQVPVNVFNIPDLHLNAWNPVLVELNEAGQLSRVVPYYDMDGGRLDLLNNSYLYFNRSLRWQRSSLATKFKNGDPKQLQAMTVDFVRRLAVLDYCLNRSTQERNYAVAFFSRDLERNDLFYAWRSSKLESMQRISIKPEDIPDKALCNSSFDLKPGHFDSRSRGLKTFTFLKNCPDKPCLTQMLTESPASTTL